jgi:Pyruvate/2-oxoacid:ferredoxin oxidoreductase delta subunit
MKAKVIDEPCFRGCGFCAKVCPKGAIRIVAAGAFLDDDECKGCSVCAEECPRGAIVLSE